MDLAFSLNCTVRELDDRLTSDEIEKIRQYAYENGGISPHRRLEKVVRESAALICLTMAQINAPKGKKFKLEDFMPAVEKVLHKEDEVVAVENLLKGLGTSKGFGNSGIKWKRKPSARG